MASGTKPTLHERICLHLDCQLKFVNNIKDPSVPISRLTARGFRVEQAEPVDGEERLNFSPCFFKPVESSFLIENPVQEHAALRSHAEIGYDYEGDGNVDPSDISRELHHYVWSRVKAYRRPLEASCSDEWVTLKETCPLRWSSRCVSPATLSLGHVCANPYSKETTPSSI